MTPNLEYGCAEIENDVHALIGFLIRRRVKHTDLRRAACRILRDFELEALDLLIDGILCRGRFDLATWRRCERLIAASTTIQIFENELRNRFRGIPSTPPVQGPRPLLSDVRASGHGLHRLVQTTFQTSSNTFNH